MTRTHKATDRHGYPNPNNNNHSPITNFGLMSHQPNIPRYFGKAGFADVNPASTKKQGGGKGNWGNLGNSELEDIPHNPTQRRRRTNSFSATAPGHAALYTKFEAADPEETVEYEEALHGPTAEDLLQHWEGPALAKTETFSSTSSSSSAKTMASVEEEGADDKVANVAGAGGPFEFDVRH